MVEVVEAYKFSRSRVGWVAGVNLRTRGCVLAVLASSVRWVHVARSTLRGAGHFKHILVVV